MRMHVVMTLPFLALVFLADPVVLSAQTFRASQDFPVGTAPTGVIVADFNRDGTVDLAVCNSGSSSISILLGTGNGSFRPRRDMALSSRPQALASGDFNGDGKLDLAVVNGQSNSVSILLGNGDGTFLPPVFTSVAGPTALVVADFNGDGNLDLAVASAASNSVQILLGRGNGTFFAPASVSVGIYPVSLALGDFNSDGRTDIAVAHSGSLYVSILIGDGHGFFQRSDVYTGGSVASIAAGDLNNDGHLDLAVLTSSGSGSPVIILMGRGDGTFDQAQRFPVGGSPLSYPIPAVSVPGGLIAIADLNNDGEPDLAVALGGSNTVSVLAGLGDGSFQPSVTFPPGAGPSGVAAADLSGDGKLDLALSNVAANSVSVLMNMTPLPRRPTFTQNSIVNGASFLTGPLVPGEIVAVLGSALGPNELTVSGSLATTLAGTRVLIGGVAAPLLYVSSTQIGAVVPLDVSGRLNAGVQINSSAGVSNIVTLPVADAAPGLFSADSSGVGQGVILNQDGSLNSAANPASAGTVVTLFGTGGGQLLNTQVTIGGFAAEVVEVVAASGQTQGAFQIQARIPTQSPTGDITVVVIAQGSPSQPGITIRVQ